MVMMTMITYYTFNAYIFVYDQEIEGTHFGQGSVVKRKTHLFVYFRLIFTDSLCNNKVFAINFHRISSRHEDSKIIMSIYGCTADDFAVFITARNSTVKFSLTDECETLSHTRSLKIIFFFIL